MKAKRVRITVSRVVRLRHRVLGLLVVMLALALLASAWPVALARSSPPGSSSLMTLAAGGIGGDLAALPEAAACGMASWVNPTGGPETASISVNLLKQGQLKILDTPLGKMDFGGGNVAYTLRQAQGRLFCTDIYHPRPYNRTYCLDSGFFSDWRVAWLVTNVSTGSTQAIRRLRPTRSNRRPGRRPSGTSPTVTAWTKTTPLFRQAQHKALQRLLGWPGQERLQRDPGLYSGVPATGVSAGQPADRDRAGDRHRLPAGPGAAGSFDRLRTSFTVRLTKGGFSLPGQTVNVATTQGSLNSASGITDSNGEAFFILRSRYGFQPTRPTNSSPGTAAITATATVLLPAGSRFVDQQDPDSRQRLVLGQSTQVTAQALGTRTWVQTDNVIIAHKFEDRNFSGVQEEDEPDLAGWQFTLRQAQGRLFDGGRRRRPGPVHREQ